MALGRRTLAATPGLTFWKLCGAGSGHGFSFRPDGRVWAILASWDSTEAAHHGTRSGLWAEWADRADQAWTVFLHPLSARGTWGGVAPFAPEPSDLPGPYAVLTRATLRTRALAAFWARVPSVNDRIGTDPDVLFKIGIGEVPLLHQVTFSIWPDLAAMTRFARQGPHAEAIASVRKGSWFAEEHYARFRVTGQHGRWTAPLERIAA